mgnify:CR=1 FL=1
MANRSYIYLKNGNEARILTEGAYTVPYFWQLFWDKKDLRTPILLWKKFEILLPIEKFHKNALKNRSFLEKNAPQTLQLYDDFVRYILANVKDGDMLGFDILEVAHMDGLFAASRKLLKNNQAIQENQPQKLDFSLTATNLIALAMGFPDYYASDFLPKDNILDSVAYQDELEKMQRKEDRQVQDQEEEQDYLLEEERVQLQEEEQVQEDDQVQDQEEEQAQEDNQVQVYEDEQTQVQEKQQAQVQEDHQMLDETRVDAKENKRGNGVIYLLLLVLVIRLVFYMSAKK